MSWTLLRQLFRTHWKRLSGILGIITLSLSLFVVITMIVENVNQQVLDQTQPLVGADIIVQSSQPLSDLATTKIQLLQAKYAFQASTKVQFSTNLVFTWVESKLVQVRWVDSLYPLYGELKLSTLPDAPETGVYVDAQTYSQFTTDDTIRIGVQQFAIQWIIEELPAASINLFDEWRTIILPYTQVESTELTQLWSRVQYETLIKTENTDQTEKLIDILSTDPAFEWQYEIEDGAWRIQQIASITGEFDRFITIVLIITFVLVATTIFIAVRTFFTNQQRSIAILKLLWQRNRSTLLLYGALFISTFVVWQILACLIGRWVLTRVSTFELAADFIIYPSAYRQAGIIALILAVISLTLPLSSIVQSSPLALLRPSSSIPSPRLLWIQTLISGLWILGIYVITLGDFLWWLIFVVWWGLAVAGLGVSIWRLLKWVVRVMYYRRGTYFLRFDGLRSMITPWNQSVLMTIGLLTTMTALLVISGVSTSFLDQLDRVSEDQPSLYVLNILPEDIDTITSQYPDSVVYDTILSRVQAVNGVWLVEHVQALWRGDADGLTREFNITSASLPLASYSIWSPPRDTEVSLEEGFARRLWVDIWDTVTFFIQWRTFDLQVTSLRTISRDGSGPFFYIQFPVDQFVDAPKTFFWLIDIPSEQKPAFKEKLLAEIWTYLSFIDTDEIIETVTDITNQLIVVVQILVGCIMIFVSISIAVCLDAMKSLKKQKIHLYGLLGATPSMIKTSLRTEQITLFGVALLAAMTLSTSVITYVVLSSEFLQGSRQIALQLSLILIIVFGVILSMIQLMYRDLL